MNLVLAAVEQGKTLAGFRAPLLTAVLALIATWVLTPYVRTFAINKGAMDDPKADDRRVHKDPFPRWGGIAIFGGILVSVCVVTPLAYPHRPMPLYLIGILLCALAIVVMGALDDLHQYSARVQAGFLLLMGIAVQFFATRVDAGHTITVQIAGLNIGSNWIDFGFLAIPLTAIYIFVVSKTMDTIDGIDGLAAGIAFIAATTLSIVATYFVLNHPNIEKSPAYNELPRVAMIAAAIAGASLGFLRYNYNPATIIMGTGGAQVLGFLLAAISIVGVLKSAVAVSLVVLLVFGIPVFDAAFVIVKRIRSGQPITQGDKRHLHHTLLKKGLSQRQAVWVLYLAAIMLCAVVFVVVRRYV